LNRKLKKPKIYKFAFGILETMVEQKQNLYKLSSVFRCVHDAHRNFNSELSPFYILSEKNCYPDGCVYFKWQCRLLAKQKTCFRGFSHVGKKCFNCRFFYEEKQHFYPQYIYAEKESNEFTKEFKSFEEWVNQLKQKRVACEGTVSAVLPDLFIKKRNNGQSLQMRGFLIRLIDGFIDNMLFSDTYYLAVSSLSQNQLAFRKGDNVEFEATLTIDRGRFKFIRPGRFQFYQRGSEKPVSRADITVLLKTYTQQENQPVKCLRCESGILVDLFEFSSGPSRILICLQGIVDHRTCAINTLSSEVFEDSCCINLEWGKQQCHHVL
jgi:hypothetical protein